MAEGNVALAFGLVIAAGACTCLGALLVFCSNLANPKWLSGSLGASAGVMIYVSFVEILSTKAVEGFEKAGYGEAQAQRYACFAFFAGLMATWLLGKAVELISSCATAWRKHRAASTQPLGTLPQHTAPSTTSTSALSTDAAIDIQDVPAANTDQHTIPAPTAVNSKDAAAVPAAAATAAAACSTATAVGPATGRCATSSAQCCADSESAAAGGRECCGCVDKLTGSNTFEQKEAQRDLLALLSADNQDVDLKRMGVLTGLAVGLHNLPEGLATFAAALASPATGVVIAIAIALHNIPEGVAVALPLYYATGSKWKGLMWAAISGAAEPLGGLIGYAVLSSTGMSQLAFGIIFAFVAGMMVYISIRELLPTAIRYDPKDSCATACAFWGMAIMAASLLLFKAKE